MKIVVVAGCAAALLCACGAQVDSPVTNLQPPTIEAGAAKMPSMSRSNRVAPVEEREERSERSAPDFKDGARYLDTSK